MGSDTSNQVQQTSQKDLYSFGDNMSKPNLSPNSFLYLGGLGVIAGNILHIYVIFGIFQFFYILI